MDAAWSRRGGWRGGGPGQPDPVTLQTSLELSLPLTAGTHMLSWCPGKDGAHLAQVEQGEVREGAWAAPAALKAVRGPACR